MAKKVLVISTSPRKGGNSDMLCGEFIKGAEAAGHKTDKIFLSDKKVAYCKGCMACMNTGKCVIKDDAADILDKMVCADVIVFATPVYFYNMSAQMKTLIDRCCPKYTKMSGKEFYAVMTAYDDAKNTTKTTVAGIQSFIDCLDGGEIKGELFAHGVNGAGEVKDTVFMKQAFEMGRSI
ncbi:Multimeric flavodoxin WrbA [Parelusimicrobium proximum]|uniref:flavodoxin family protein n=1 Tax=Parelusimicrobium proximum TaxID=3228953 RepID=UPI003D16D726